MAEYDFKGLMGDTQPSTQNNTVDFSGLMDTPKKKEIKKKSKTLSKINKDILTRRTQIYKNIAERGNVWGNIKKDLESENVGRMLRGSVGIVSSPLTQLESGIANPALKLQEGVRNPKTLAKEAFLGFIGRKQGQYGDVFRVAGVPSPIAASAGLVLSLSPLKTVQTLNKTFKGISKLTDKGIMKAGKELIKAAKSAENYTGTKLNEAFKTVDVIKSNPDDFISAMSKLPKALIKKIEDTFGSVEDLANNITIGRLRDVKRIIGKYKPTSFGKETRGLPENIDADDINKVYSMIKTLMEKTLRNVVGKDLTNKLMKLEDAFSEVKGASNFIRKSVVDPILLKPTKGGSIARKIAAEGDVSARTALNILKKSGNESRKAINHAVESLNAFNKWLNVLNLSRGIGRAALYGGIGGYLGSKILSSQFRDNESSEFARY